MAFTAIRSGLQASSAEEDFQPYFVDNGCDGSLQHSCQEQWSGAVAHLPATAWRQVPAHANRTFSSTVPLHPEMSLPIES